jgi:hypothetical protein
MDRGEEERPRADAERGRQQVVKARILKGRLARWRSRIARGGLDSGLVRLQERNNGRLSH